MKFIKKSACLFIKKPLLAKKRLELFKWEMANLGENA
jgi:hypothetical protein